MFLTRKWAAATLGVACTAALGFFTVPQASAHQTYTPPVKLMTIIEENHDFSQAKSGMPYLWSLAQQYGYASNYNAITHPSLPNYMAIAGGSTFGITNDHNPPANTVSGQSVFDQAVAKGYVSKTYAESMPSNCYLSNYPSGTPNYYVHHNPWAYFSGKRTNCNKYDQPLTNFSASNIPKTSFVVPNIYDDAHNGTLAEADTWLKNFLPQVFNSTDFTSGKLAVVITFDEGTSGDNNVLTVVCDVNLHGEVVTTSLNHYSLSRWYSNIVGDTGLNNAATAPNMETAFGF